MAVFFQPLRSGSSGNCLLVYDSAGDALVIDCGFRTARDTRAAFADLDARNLRLLGLLITHDHTDHLGDAAARALLPRGLTYHLGRHTAKSARQRLVRPPPLAIFDRGEPWEWCFTVGPFHVRPIEVPHDPAGQNFAFILSHRDTRLVIATDLYDGTAIAPHLPGADLVYLESNHDPELLRMHPNPASRFHLSNPKAARLLVATHANPPRHVVLGHLSERRNTPSLALAEVDRAFADAGVRREFTLSAAPRYVPGDLVELG